MNRTNQLYIKAFFVTLIAAMIAVSCSKKDDDDDDPINVDQLINEVRDLTKDFHDIEVAMAAGWEVDLSGCVEHPSEGGMGHHFGRPEFIDGRVNHLEPQVLLYEPEANGGFKFLGVEYIVPFAILPSDAEAPELFGHQFHANHELELWALHVWTERENSKGMFYDWNPGVSCQFPDEINELKEITSSFHDIEAAMNAGWAVDLSGCVEHPEEGGMGHHFGRPEFIDGRVDFREPQVLLYEPEANGGFRFVGVEYIVPFAILSADADPPVLFGHEFHANHELEIWALHMWTERDNPNGMFYDWNPTVSCHYVDDIAEVRELTADYHDIEIAKAAGWDVDMSGCVEHPTEGGMGHHFGRPEYIDGRVDFREPQVLLYEPGDNDEFIFVGVEYIVPFAILPADADPPVLFGHEFHANHELEIWALHMWTEKENPKGMFYDWNPDVSCQ